MHTVKHSIYYLHCERVNSKCPAMCHTLPWCVICLIMISSFIFSPRLQPFGIMKKYHNMTIYKFYLLIAHLFAGLSNCAFWTLCLIWSFISRSFSQNLKPYSMMLSSWCSLSISRHSFSSFFFMHSGKGYSFTLTFRFLNTSLKLTSMYFVLNFLHPGFIEFMQFYFANKDLLCSEPEGVCLIQSCKCNESSVLQYRFL